MREGRFSRSRLGTSRLRGFRGGGGSAPPNLLGYYGTGLGQVPLHLAPEDAVLDASGNVTGIANRGGAGAAFAATASGTGILVSAGRFSVPTLGPFLSLAGAADLLGVRVFFAGQISAGLSTHDPRIAGSSVHNTHVRINRTTGRLTLNRGAESLTLGGTAIAPTAAMNLYELEVVNGQARVALNGLSWGTDVACAWADFRTDRFLTGQSHPFEGVVGDIVSMVTDGSAAMDDRAAEIRSILAAKYGITLA